MNKATKQMVNAMVASIGEVQTVYLLGGIMGALVDMSDKAGGNFEIRSLKMTINDYFEYDILEIQKQLWKEAQES